MCAKNRKLQEETFNFNVYVQKVCGFLTARPLFWLKQFDNYALTTSDTAAIFRYKILKNQRKCYTALIDLSYQTTRKTEVVINFLSGVVLIKGDNFKHWVETEASRIWPFLVSSQETTSKTEDKDGESGVGEMQKQMESLWREIDANKTSIENIGGLQSSLH